MSDLLNRLGIQAVNSGAWLNAPLQCTGEGVVESFNPTTGEPLASRQGDAVSKASGVGSCHTHEREFSFIRLQPC